MGFFLFCYELFGRFSFILKAINTSIIAVNTLFLHLFQKWLAIGFLIRQSISANFIDFIFKLDAFFMVLLLNLLKNDNFLLEILTF